jgi:hypothetical protein
LFKMVGHVTPSRSAKIILPVFSFILLKN